MNTISNRNTKAELQKVKKWPWVTLLILLAYEGAGCLIGGTLLIAAPDGRFMDMPVDIMHGSFNNFLIPGIILFGLGALNTVAFISVLRKTNFDWVVAGFAIGGLTIWFIVEIIILQELHWLHLMWGFPVFLGFVVLLPLFIPRAHSSALLKTLLICGILSSLWYSMINIMVPMYYEGYSIASLTVSELSAIGSPTRILWVLTVMMYPFLFTAFGWGVRELGSGSRLLRVTGGMIIIYSILNFYWPPMHQRHVLASGGGTLTDTLHITWAIMTLLFMTLIMAFGAAASGKQFRIYTIATWVTFIVFGILTFMESPGIETNQPTPWIGLWERINIGAFMLWIVVFAIMLLRRIQTSGKVQS